MAQMHGTIERPLDETATEIRRVAGEQGWAISEHESVPNQLVFKNGMSAFSWGSQLTAALTAATPTETGIQITTKETFSLADWGRGKRQAVRLLEGVGAELI